MPKKENKSLSLISTLGLVVLPFKWEELSIWVVLLGEWLDGKYPNPNQMYVKICTLVAVFLAMYSVIRQVSNLSNND